MNSDQQQNKLTLSLAGAQPQGWETLPIANADIRLIRDFLPSKRASQLQELLTKQVAWRRDHVQLFGKRHRIPRLHQWYGEPGAVYRWSGIDMEPQPWLAELELVRNDSIVKGSGKYKIWVEIDGKPVASAHTTIPNQSTVYFEDLLGR